jgi:hypothetical protein
VDAVAMGLHAVGAVAEPDLEWDAPQVRDRHVDVQRFCNIGIRRLRSRLLVWVAVAEQRTYLDVVE